MAELTVPPLLAHRPEASPPWRWRHLLLPILFAGLGILIATACAISGQDVQRHSYTTEMQRDYAEAEAALAQAQLRHDDPDTIAKLEDDLDAQRARGLPSYARYGRQFTQWDGYRYEEIITRGYAYHHPDDPPSVQESALITPAGESQPRLKNVAWYPLYPLLGAGVARVLGVAPSTALTIVSQTCIVLATIVFFLYARRHYYNRLPKLAMVGASRENGGGTAAGGGDGDAAPSRGVSGVGGEKAAQTATLALAEQHPMRRWDLSPQDTAALWAMAALLYAPCSIFLYANFTESLFVLLLVSFLYCLQGRWWWRAALVAALASSCRAQGVLFGPLLALTFLLRSDLPRPVSKIVWAVLLGLVGCLGLAAYSAYLHFTFGDALAFQHVQRYWNVGFHRAQVYNALNPVHALTQVLRYAFYTQPMDWPRLWEAMCIIWPPIVLLILGGRFLSFELEVMGWLLWGVPYVTNGLAGNPPLSSEWMSMGRFMAVMIPAQIIFGAVFARFRWAGIPCLALAAAAFGVFAYKFGAGAWVG